MSDFDWLTADIDTLIDASTDVGIIASADAARKTRKVYDHALGCVVERYEDEIEQELNKSRGLGVFQAGA